MVSAVDLSKSKTDVLSKSVILGSLTTFSSKIVSKINGLLSGLRYIFSTSNSSITPPSRAQRLLLPMCEVAPKTHNRTSLDELPPNTGRSVTSTTFMPARAAVMAPHNPAKPPPTTTRSAANVTLLGVLLPVASALIIPISFKNSY